MFSRESPKTFISNKNMKQTSWQKKNTKDRIEVIYIDLVSLPRLLNITPTNLFKKSSTNKLLPGSHLEDHPRMVRITPDLKTMEFGHSGPGSHNGRTLHLALWHLSSDSQIMSKGCSITETKRIGHLGSKKPFSVSVGQDF